MICSNPGIYQAQILGKFAGMDAPSKTTVRKYLEELEEKDKRIRRHDNGKFVEYTAVKDVPTEELDKTLNHNLDKLEEFFHDVRQNAKKYPYDAKHEFNYKLDYLRVQLNEAVDEIRRKRHDRAPEVRRVCEKIRGMADEKSGDSTFQARQDLKHVSTHISNQYRTMSDNFSQMYEKYHKIKRRDRKQAAHINQQMECDGVKMNALESDLEKIHDKLRGVVHFDRTDVDLCKLADEMRAKHMPPHARRQIRFTD